MGKIGGSDLWIGSAVRIGRSAVRVDQSESAKTRIGTALTPKKFNKRVQLPYTQCIDIGLDVTKSAPPGGAPVNLKVNYINFEPL